MIGKKLLQIIEIPSDYEISYKRLFVSFAKHATVDYFEKFI